MIQDINDAANGNNVSNNNDSQFNNTEHPTQSLDWLTRLIAFDTVSRHSNLSLQWVLSLARLEQLWFSKWHKISRRYPFCNERRCNTFISSSKPAMGPVTGTFGATA